MPHLEFTLTQINLISHSRRIVRILFILCYKMRLKQQFETQKTRKTPFACQEQLHFIELNHSDLSITNEYQNPSLISTEISQILKTPRAQLINEEKSFFA